MNQSTRRAYRILLVVVLLLCVCIMRPVNLQIVQAPELVAKDEAVHTSKLGTAVKRGQITDAIGMVLADSILTYDIAVNQENIRKYVHYEKQEVKEQTKNVIVGYGSTEAARQLFELSGTSAAELGGLLTGSSEYEYVGRDVDVATYHEIRALNIYGIEWEAVYGRTYPNGALATPAVGAVDANGEGSSGTEARYMDSLKRVPGVEVFEIVPNGAVIPGGKQTVKSPADGASIASTIYTDPQHQVQELLDERVSRHQADWGSIVVEDVSTGQILVLADSDSTVSDNVNLQAVFAVQYVVEPGSVDKFATSATALGAGSIMPTTVLNVPYQLDLVDAGGPIMDFYKYSGEVLTTTGVPAESSNTETVLVDQTVNDEQRYIMMRGLGFGEPTGIELPGETGGSVRLDTE